MATAVFLISVILASVIIFYIHSEVVSEQVVVNGVSGQIYDLTGGSKLSMWFSYPAPPSGPSIYTVGNTFTVTIYLTGSGTIDSVDVKTPGFAASSIEPTLPLRVNNSTESSMIILGIRIDGCCFNGTVRFAVNGGE
ncbi:MAG: hypothetical protein ACREBS_05915 [Nitrososphaerales archaeon]